LLYVYINDYQSGGEMWYAVFNRSLISLLFAVATVLGDLSLQFQESYFAGPFYFFLPLPLFIIYFWHFCDAKFKKPSMNLSFAFAKELDIRDNDRRASGRPVPQDLFSTECYRQPSLIEKEVYPEPYRKDATYDLIRRRNTSVGSGSGGRGRLGSVESVAPPAIHMIRHGSISIDEQQLDDELEEDHDMLRAYFQEVVMPLSVIPKKKENNDARNPMHTPTDHFDEEENKQRLESPGRSRN